MPGQRHDTLLDLLTAVDLANDAPFVLAADGTAVATYADASRRSAQLARAIRDAGLVPGDRVAMQVDKSVDALMLYLACVRSGAVLLPMNPGYTPSEVAHLVADFEPQMMVDDAGLAELVERSRCLPDHFDDHSAQPDDLAAILATSGTTGRPKGAMLSHRNLTSNTKTLRGLWGFASDDVLLHALPIFHTHGLFVATNCTIANGSPMVFLPRFDVDQVLAALPHCTVMMGVPTYYTRLLADSRFGSDVCVAMRLFISGSAPLPASVHGEFAARVGHTILERYGMTETSMLTSNPLLGERRAGTVGFPLPEVEVRIAAEAGAHGARPTGVGAIEVRGPNVFAGYWRRPELASTEFTSDGWFCTGDVGRFDADGYLHIVGRSKDLIITGGLNVYPKEVEDVLDALPGVAESAVIGVPDADFGEAVVGVVVARHGTLDPATLVAQARQHLAAFKTPKRVHVVTALPRNAMGKVEKAALRARFGAAADDPAAP